MTMQSNTIHNTDSLSESRTNKQTDEHFQLNTIAGLSSMLLFQIPDKFSSSEFNHSRGTYM